MKTGFESKKSTKWILAPVLLVGLGMTASAEAMQTAAASPLFSMGVIGAVLLIVFGVAMYKSV